MGVIFPTSSDGQVVSVPVGTTIGVILYTHHDVTYRGTGYDCIIKADTTFQYLAQSILAGCRSVTFEDLTIDCDNLSSMIAAIVSSPVNGPMRVYLRGVRIVNYHRITTALLCQTHIDVRDATLIGMGRGYLNHFGSHCVDGLTIIGGTGGIFTSDGSPGQHILGSMKNVIIKLDWFANPVCESGLVPTAFDPLYVDVESHVGDHRNLYDSVRVLLPVGSWVVGDPLPVGVEEWSRIELADGRWTQLVCDDSEYDIDDKWRAIGGSEFIVDEWKKTGQWAPLGSTPTGETAIIYNVRLMRLMSWTATRLSLQSGETPDYARWTNVNGDPTPLPASVPVGARVDILRHAFTGQALLDGVRDVDAGGIQINDPTLGCIIERVYVRGGFSDMVTVRGDCFTSQVTAAIGQDMCFTVDALAYPQRLKRVRAVRAGFHGLILINGNSTVDVAHTHQCGRHGLGYGVAADEDSAGSYVRSVSHSDVTGAFSGASQTSTPNPISMVVNRG